MTTNNSATANLSVQRPHAEVLYRNELEAIIEQDTFRKPANWLMSPKAVRLFIMGGKLPNGRMITSKYIGDQKLIDTAICTLITDRALLLTGIPGTAKSYVSELLSAAVSGESNLLIQGTAGTDENALRYGWNYALLLTEGPSMKALVKSPIMLAMEEGKICRIEELTRLASETQDALITILSERTLSVPELGIEVQAKQGFNIICTANNRDRGVNDLSSAMLRRLNIVVLPTPATAKEEVEIVRLRVTDSLKALDIPVDSDILITINKIITVFRELRNGITTDGKTKVKSPSATLSPAEAISLVNSAAVQGSYLGNGKISSQDLAGNLTSAVCKDPVTDTKIFGEYLELLKERSEFVELYKACKATIS